MDALGEQGALGLYWARQVIKEHILLIDADDPELPAYIHALTALDRVLEAIGALEARPTRAAARFDRNTDGSLSLGLSLAR